MPFEEKFGLHLGQFVKEKIKELNLEQTEVAKRMSISKSGLANKFLRPHFGTVYDLMEASQAIGVNLFDLVISALDKEGLPHNEYYTPAEYKELKDELKECTKEKLSLQGEKESLYKVINKLTK